MLGQSPSNDVRVGGGPDVRTTRLRPERPQLPSPPLGRRGHVTASQKNQSNGRQTRVAEDLRHATEADGQFSETLEIRPEVLLKNREFFLHEADV